MNDKYSLSELKEFLFEPSFDGRAYEIFILEDVVNLLKDAIDHHNELEKFENRRGI